MNTDWLVGFLMGATTTWFTLYLRHLTNKLFVKQLKETLESHNKESKEIANELIEKTAAVVAAQSLENPGKLN